MPTSHANLADRDWPPVPGSTGDGLLEQPLLRIGRPDADGRRGIRDRRDQLVGHCYPRRLPWWWRWLGPGLAVVEAHEQPLVFVVLPALSFGNRQVVHDAEADLIGTVARHHLEDRWGRPLLRHRALAEGGGQFEGPAGEVVARWTEQADELTLELHGAWLAGPFERMLVLARALTGG